MGGNFLLFYSRHIYSIHDIISADREWRLRAPNSSVRKTRFTLTPIVPRGEPSPTEGGNGNGDGDGDGARTRTGMETTEGTQGVGQKENGGGNRAVGAGVRSGAGTRAET